MPSIDFDCGCSFRIIGLPPKEGSLPLIENNIEKSPLNCKRTWDMLSQGLTKGVFQLESGLGRSWTRKLKPDNINDLTALGSLLRPGCLRAIDKTSGLSMTDLYCKRKNGEMPVVYYHPALEPILGNTYGVLCFQEQSMAIAVTIAGFNMQEADELRKSIGKKLAEEMKKVEAKFLAGCAKTNIVNEEHAKEIWSWIKESQRYSFNRSHAACYAVTGYHTAYDKAHFPLQFFTSYLSHAKDDAHPRDEIRELIDEAKLMDIEVLPPDLRKLNEHFEIDNQKIVFGLSNIKGLGGAHVRDIKEGVTKVEQDISKKVSQWSWFEILVYLTPEIGISTMSTLICAGALQYLQYHSRTKMLAELNALSALSQGEQAFLYNHTASYTNLIDALKGVLPSKKNGGGTHDDKRREIVNGQIMLLENPPTSMEDTPNWIAGTEEMLLGIAITCSRIDGCNVSAINCTCRDFIKGNLPKGAILLGVEIQNVNEWKVKQGKTAGKKMGKLVVTDGTCSLNEVTVFADVWEKFGSLLAKGNTVILRGDRDWKNHSNYIVKEAWLAELVDNGVD